VKYVERNKGLVAGDDFWDDLARRVLDGKVIPIISNSMRDDRLLEMFEAAGDDIDTLIAESWAQYIQYPLLNPNDLARVAQFHQVMSREGPEKAKRDYLRFLTTLLLEWARANDPAARAAIEAQGLGQDPNMGFADLMVSLGYPRYPAGHEDPLRLLARMPLPIYVTTSYYDFLERHLEAENKVPRREVCMWAGQPAKIDRAFHPDPGYEPTPERPLVFHLFGLERFPHSVVLSVDDFLKFLVQISVRDADAKSSLSSGDPPTIPTYLSGELNDLPLLLLGYRLQDWDFQVLYRGLITAKPPDARRDAGVVIQLEPTKQRGAADPEAARRYLQQYFEHDVKFRVDWSTPQDFVSRLYQAYQARA
jgi:hypothetical protein